MLAGMMRHFGTVKSEILIHTVPRRRKIPFIISLFAMQPSDDWMAVMANKSENLAT
jgi:hypothetical protein